MSSCVRTYAPEEVSLNIALLFPAEAFSEESIINISKEEDYFRTNVGAAGGVERFHVSNPVYSIEIVLSQTSPTNAILTALATVDDLSRLATFPVFAKDSSGSSLFLATTCWVDKPPEADYSNRLKDRRWVLKSSDLVFNLGGNGEDGLAGDIAKLTSLAGQFASVL